MKKLSVVCLIILVIMIISAIGAGAAAANPVSCSDLITILADDGVGWQCGVQDSQNMPVGNVSAEVMCGGSGVILYPAEGIQECSNVTKASFHSGKTSVGQVDSENSAYCVAEGNLCWWQGPNGLEKASLSTIKSSEVDYEFLPWKCPDGATVNNGYACVQTK